jgi:hypothetical protein
MHIILIITLYLGLCNRNFIFFYLLKLYNQGEKHKNCITFCFFYVRCNKHKKKNRRKKLCFGRKNYNNSLKFCVCVCVYIFIY